MQSVILKTFCRATGQKVLLVSLFYLFSIKSGWGWLSSSIAPTVLWFFLRGVNNIRYAIDYRWRCKSDIERLDEICDNDHVQRIFEKGISNDEIIKERKYVVESLKKRGKLNNLINRVGLVNIVRRGVPAGIVVRNKDDVKTLLEDMFSVDDLKKQGVNSSFFENNNNVNNNNIIMINNNDNSKNTIIKNNSNNFNILNIKRKNNN